MHFFPDFVRYKFSCQLVYGFKKTDPAHILHFFPDLVQYKLKDAHRFSYVLNGRTR
jgi:hypothetical protein